MIQLGVNRTWLAQECDYTPDSLRQILAPNGKGKTDKALRRIWEALDREEQRQKTALGISEFLPFRLVLEPDKEQFDRWMRAAYKSHNSFEQWAKQGLDKYAGSISFIYQWFSAATDNRLTTEMHNQLAVRT